MVFFLYRHLYFHHMLFCLFLLYSLFFTLIFLFLARVMIGFINFSILIWYLLIVIQLFFKLLVLSFLLFHHILLIHMILTLFNRARSIINSKFSFWNFSFIANLIKLLILFFFFFDWSCLVLCTVHVIETLIFINDKHSNL